MDQGANGVQIGKVNRYIGGGVDERSHEGKRHRDIIVGILTADSVPVSVQFVAKHICNVRSQHESVLAESRLLGDQHVKFTAIAASGRDTEYSNWLTIRSNEADQIV